jgi:hypothetical protein
MTKTTHMTADIATALQFSDSELTATFQTDNGGSMTPQQIREELIRMLRAGFDVVPGAGCDNHDETGRCRGHVSEGP